MPQNNEVYCSSYVEHHLIFTYLETAFFISIKNKITRSVEIIIPKVQIIFN